ncbi:hypothetical protein TH1_124 [Shewanella phage Thanatos-1]|nr:hypothetical protein TH1_124 [Shewanella phage Thanatos-1]
MISSIEFKATVAKAAPTNHIFVVDVSGSMYSELPKIRTHLKENLPTLVKELDTVSIIYFADRGQFGPVFVGQPVCSLKDLTEINNAIDRYLKPQGCTGFVEPLELALTTAKCLENGNLNSLIFMTDGYDNCWKEEQILSACSNLPTVFTDISFIEYGWNCNRSLLEKMSNAVNGFHSFTESFKEFEQSFGEIIQSRTSKRVEIDVPGAEAVVYIDDKSVRVVNVVNDKALVPEHVEQLWAVTPDLVDMLSYESDEQELYVALFYAVSRMNPELAWKTLKILGDVKLINEYNNCFTKQDYSNIKEQISKAVLCEGERYLLGVDYELVPDENAPTVLDVLEVLIENNASLDTTSPDFSYNRIGRKTKTKEDSKIDDLTKQIAETDSKEERRKLAMELALHEEWTPEFKSNDGPISLRRIVTNSSRPNISVNTALEGRVELPFSKQIDFNLPESLPSTMFRNYTIVKDGIINMKKLPVIVPAITLNDLDGIVDYQVTDHVDDNVHITIELTSVPLVNRAMIKDVSGTKFATAHVHLQSLKALQKVLKHKRDEILGVTNTAKLKELYGEEAALWLSENGIRDYGFAPKTEREESTDVYMSKELNVKIKGLSALPSVNAVLAKVEGNKKLNVADQMVYDAIQKIEAELTFEDNPEAYISKATADAIEKVRKIEGTLSKIMYAVVVGKSWFNDVDFDSPTITVTVGKTDYQVTFELEEKEIKI